MHNKDSVFCEGADHPVPQIISCVAGSPYIEGKRPGRSIKISKAIETHQ